MESRNIKESPFRNIDWFTVVIYLLLVIAGAISIYAASYDFDNSSIFDFNEFSGKQIRWVFVSLAVGFILLLIDARMYETYAYPIYVAMVFILVVTIFIAPDIKGSRSWIVLGPISIQPAEFAKFATSLALAKLFSGYNFSLNARGGNYVRALAIIFIPIMLILAQRETGSALAYLALFFVLYREGMSGLILLAAAFAVVIFVVTVKFSETVTMGITTGEFSVFILIMITMVSMLMVYCRNIMATRNVLVWFVGTGVIATILYWCGVAIPGYWYFGVVIGVASIYCIIELIKTHSKKILITFSTVALSVIFLFSVNYVFNNVLENHQQMRIKVTLGLEQDLRKAGYNVNQSKIAIGSGGFAGKGFLKGTQTKLKYVPEQHTDFIFCTIGEEEGFIGTTTVMLLFILLTLRVISLAERQPSAFGRVYAYCVASIFIFHFCINIGMVIGLCPVIGIPLPFFSYGGSSLLGFTLLLFILLRIDAARRGQSRNF